jgi:hypothetical protein
MTYPHHPNAVTKKKYYEFIQNLPLFLPVEEISGEFSKLIDKYPITPYLDNRDSFVRWMHFIHNKINEKLEKPQISLNEFFVKVDFSDPGYDHLIWLYETFRTYVNVMVNSGVVEDQVEYFIENIISKTPDGSHARLQCLGATIAVMQAQKHPLLAKYGKRFVSEFQDKAPEAAMPVNSTVITGSTVPTKANAWLEFTGTITWLA